MNPKTAQQINDPQTGRVITSRHSALSELMIQNAELREQLRVLHASYDALSQMKEKKIASRIETDELRAENEELKAENARLAVQLFFVRLDWCLIYNKHSANECAGKDCPFCRIENTLQSIPNHDCVVEHLKSENARLSRLVEGKDEKSLPNQGTDSRTVP